MQAFLRQLKSRVGLSRPSLNHVIVDTLISTLHYRATSTLLLVCCALVSSRQYFGEPILCIQDVPGEYEAPIPSHVLNTYCFVTSTYTVVGPSGVRKRRHAYYQWVPFVLLLQALLFAAPNAAWINWEGGLVRGSVAGLRDDVRGTDKEKLRTLARYFVARLHTFRIWAAGFYVCELLNLLNVVGNIYLTDALLGGNFFQYGIHMSLYGLKVLDSPSTDAIFPKVTKCLFQKYGPSGTIQTHDALCVMALNIVNEKIFTALWFWFCLLALISALAVLWRLLVLFLLSCATAHSRSFLSGWAQKALGAPVTLDPIYISPVTRSLDFGDWLFLQLLGVNLGVRVYKDFMEHLVYTMEQAKHSEIRPMLAN
ncbi:Innexin inx3 [Blattella germanica]|nr:Innexin inx3 [Blattella germanica]